MRTIAVDAGTLAALRSMRAEAEEFAKECGESLHPDGFVFSVSPDGLAIPHPDVFSRNFRRLCDRVGVAPDLHLALASHFHSIRSITFEASSMVVVAADSVVAEAQKQARMGWSTIHMARHYTYATSSEDGRAADHIGVLLDQPG